MTVFRIWKMWNFRLVALAVFVLIDIVHGNWPPDYEQACHAPIISNGNVSPSGWILHGDCLTVTCDTGYTLSGNSRVYCTEGELGSIPSCTRTVIVHARCSVPSISNGYFSPTGWVNHGGTTRATCNSGYALSGSSTISCNDGSWSSTPRCNRIPLPCGVPSVSNGATSSTGSIAHGQSTTVICHSGYNLPSGVSPTIQCNDGAWGSIPQCYEQCEVQNITNSNSFVTRSFNHGSSWTVVCNSGFSYDQQTTFSLSCNDGVVSGVPIDKCYLQCNLLGVVNSNAPISSVLLHGSYATIVCNNGFSYNQMTYFPVECKDGTIVGVVPVECYESCDIPTINNGRLTSSGPFYHGFSANITCDNGYNAVSTAAACFNGTWGSETHCYAQCPMDGVENSDLKIATTIEHGSFLEINCLSGYSYNRALQVVITCNDGILTDTPEQCYKDCPEFPSISNGVLSGGTRHSDTAYYGCDGVNDGNMSELATCSDGIWSDDTIPVCHGEELAVNLSVGCESDDFVVKIPRILLGIYADAGDVSMGGCIGTQRTRDYIYINSSYNECGTFPEVDDLNQRVIYTNKVIPEHSGDDVVTTRADFVIDVECIFEQNIFVSSSALIQRKLRHELQNTGRYQMMFSAYTDGGYDDVITANDEINTNDVIFLRAEVVYVNDVDVYPSRCYATPQPAADFTQSYDLIEEGCSVSTYASHLRIDASTRPNFAFQIHAFRFIASDGDSIYIHCELKICPVLLSNSSDCQLPENCPADRRKRSTQMNYPTQVVAEPIRFHKATSENGESEYGTYSVGWLVNPSSVYIYILSTLLIISVIITIYVTVFRKPTRPSDLTDASSDRKNLSLSRCA